MPIPVSSQHQISIIQATIDSIVESTLIQAFLTGVYALVFFQAIVPAFRERKKIIVAILSILFITITINLAATWQICRSVMVVHDATRETMAQDIFTGPESPMQKVAYGTLALSVLLADTFMVWRCYVLWQRSRWILIIYAIILVGELVLLPVFLGLNITLGSHFGFLDLYFVLSFCTTITTSGLIIYRIVDVSGQGNNDLNRYRYTIKILVESGMLYTAAIMICGITHLLEDFGVVNPSTIQAVQVFDAILVPITGLAPTLITARNAISRAKISDPEKSSESNAISRLSFKKDESGGEQSHIIEISDSNTDVSSKQWQARTV